MTKISVCLTVKNEDIDEILKQLILQSDLPTEIVIVDASSKNWFTETKKKAYARYNIKYIKKLGNRSVGRNLAANKATSDNLLFIDAGCELHLDLIKNISLSLLTPTREIVAGSYSSRVFTFQEYIFAKFLNRSISDKNFYPSARNFGIKKKVFMALHGFNESLDTAEDLEFFKRALDSGFKITKNKNATLYWNLPSFKEYVFKIFHYAFGDAKSRIFWDTRKKLATHNIKHILTISRWLVLLILTLFGYIYVAVFLFVLYVLSTAIKHKIDFSKFNFNFILLDFINFLEFVLIKVVTDFSVMLGFISGILSHPHE